MAPRQRFSRTHAHPSNRQGVFQGFTAILRWHHWPMATLWQGTSSSPCEPSELRTKAFQEHSNCSPLPKHRVPWALTLLFWGREAQVTNFSHKSVATPPQQCDLPMWSHFCCTGANHEQCRTPRKSVFSITNPSGLPAVVLTSDRLLKLPTVREDLEGPSLISRLS